MHLSRRIKKKPKQEKLRKLKREKRKENSNGEDETMMIREINMIAIKEIEKELLNNSTSLKYKRKAKIY